MIETCKLCGEKKRELVYEYNEFHLCDNENCDNYKIDRECVNGIAKKINIAIGWTK